MDLDLIFQAPWTLKPPEELNWVLLLISRIWILLLPPSPQPALLFRKIKLSCLSHLLRARILLAKAANKLEGRMENGEREDSKKLLKGKLADLS